MRYHRILPLTLAAACMIFLGPDFAQARTMSSSTVSTNFRASHAGQHEAMLMVPARADLVRPIVAAKVKDGQHFTAKLSKAINLKNGPKLPRGTQLIGKVVKDKMGTDGKTSTLALQFTKAELKGGKLIPIKATIVGIYPPSNSYDLSYFNGAMPNEWTPSTLQVDQINVLSGIDLHSKIAAKDSGVLVSKKKDKMKLGSGSEFALAIAAQGKSAHAVKQMAKNHGA